MTDRAERLRILAQIAAIKADRAKADLAKARQKADALAMEASALRRQRTEIASQNQAPETAGVAARWISSCDVKLRHLSLEEARARAVQDRQHDVARFEEGRRQVLGRLRDQAS